MKNFLDFLSTVKLTQTAEPSLLANPSIPSVTVDDEEPTTEVPTDAILPKSSDAIPPVDDAAH